MKMSRALKRPHVIGIATTAFFAVSACRPGTQGGDVPLRVTEAPLDSKSLERDLRASGDALAKDGLAPVPVLQLLPKLESATLPAPVKPIPRALWEPSKSVRVIASSDAGEHFPTQGPADACEKGALPFGTPLVVAGTTGDLLSVCLVSPDYGARAEARDAGIAVTKETAADGKHIFRLEGRREFLQAVVTFLRPSSEAGTGEAPEGGGAAPVPEAATIRLFPTAAGKEHLGVCAIGAYPPTPVERQDARCRARDVEFQVRESGGAAVLRVVASGTELAVIPFSRVSF